MLLTPDTSVSNWVSGRNRVRGMNSESARGRGTVKCVWSSNSPYRLDREALQTPLMTRSATGSLLTRDPPSLER